MLLVITALACGIGATTFVPDHVLLWALQAVSGLGMSVCLLKQVAPRRSNSSKSLWDDGVPVQILDVILICTVMHQ